MVSAEETETRFCPVHGDYAPRGADTSCPRCAEDPLVSRQSLRSVKVVTADPPTAPPVGETSTVITAITSADDAPTPIADVAACPSCEREVPLEEFQSEALGEVWEGEAALWAEDGVCRDCYRDVLPGLLRRWTTDEWLAHHFEGWRRELRKVHDVEVSADSEADAWLPGEDRHRILDVEKSLSARREHLARSRMRLRELKNELGLAEDPPEFVAALEEAHRALEPSAVAELERRRAADLERETERRVASVTELSPSQLIRDAGLDPDEVIGELAGSTGSRRRIPVPDFANVGDGVRERPLWPVAVFVAGVVAFGLWWWLGR